MSDPIVGIDLGTSNSVIAHVDGAGAVRVLADEAGYKIHPSVVSFHPNGGVVVGSPAKQRKVIDPKNTIYSAKRLIGRSFHSPEVTTARGRMPYQIIEGANQQPRVVTRGGDFAIPEISAIVLDHVRNVAASQLQQSIERAVVTVPATFNDAQRSATATAGAIAGLTIVRVLNEPTAAALAYGNLRNLNETIVVYDFGGGTFDVTILKLEGDVYEVLGTSGDTFLGGDDLDERLVDRMIEKFLAEHRVDLRMNEVSMMRLRAVAEQTKIELSRRSRALVRVDEVAYGPNGKPLDLNIEIARDEFVRHVADIVDRTFPVCQEAMTYAQLTMDRISDVVLVGGTTKIPYVRDQVARFFGKAPRADVSAEDAVAIGAALQASALEHLLNRTSPPKIARKHLADEPSETTAARPQLAPKPRLPVAATDERTETAVSPLNEPRSADVSRPPRLQTERPASPGRHHDRFQTPPPIPMPATQIGRMARPAAVPTTTPSRPIPSIPSIPTLNPGAAAKPAEPVPRAMGPALTMRGHAVTSLPPAIVNDDSAITVTGEAAYAPPASQAPTLVVEPQPLPPAPPSAPTVPAMNGVALPLPSAPAIDDVVAAPARSPVVLEVTPRGLGIATVAGYCEELIRRNSRIPTEIRKLFTTSRDGQDTVRIVVCQGESRRLDHNVVLGDLTLSGLPPKPRGEMSLEVTFLLDASGILHVRAREANTGREQRASLDLVGAMADSEIEASRERVQRLRK